MNNKVPIINNAQIIAEKMTLNLNQSSNQPQINNFHIHAKYVQAGYNNTMNFNGMNDTDEESSDDESLSNDQDDQLGNCDYHIDDDRLTELSETFGKDWQYLGEDLGISEKELDEMASTPIGQIERSRKVLEMWMDINKKTTICDLVNRLEENEDTADRFKKQLYKAVFKPKKNLAIGGPPTRPAIAVPSDRLAIELPPST